MLSAMRQFWLLFTVMALAALSSALDLHDVHLDGIGQFMQRGEKRQASGTGNTAASSQAPQTSDAPSSQAPSATPTPTPTPQQPSSQAPTQAPSSNAPAQGSSAAASSRAPATSAAPSATSGKAASSATSLEIFTSDLVGTSVQQYTTIFTTVSDGQTITGTSTGSRTLTSKTGQVAVTQTASIQGGNSGNSKGLSDSNKKVIGGVVGGVGGALLLGGIAIVAWRIWGKKKRVSEDDDDLMAGTGAALGDKPHNNSNAFQSNLEQYHNPGGRPNAAANF